jgi:long-chain acyl-CoA synthetase
MDKPWIKHYDQGVPETLAPYPQQPLHTFLEKAAERFPDRKAIIFQPSHQGFAGSSLTYRQVNDLADHLAAALVDMGVKKGDRVVIFMPNIPQFIITYYAILKAGGVVVATNPLYSPREIEHQLNDCGAEVAIVMSLFYKTLKSVQPNTKLKQVIVTSIKDYMGTLIKLLFSLTREQKDGHKVESLAAGDQWWNDVLAKYAAAPKPNIDVGPDDTALFQYTGGTTGVAKGAVALHRNLVANTLQSRAWFVDIKDGQDTQLAAIPLFHVYGMVVAMSLSVQAAATMIVVPNARDIVNVLTSIDKHKPSLFPGVPTLYNAINNHPDLAKYDVKSIQACISGSAPLMPETKLKFESVTGGKLMEGYGLSEAPTATHCNPLHGENRTGSIGLPFPDVECRIVSLDDGETDMPVGEIGELAIRGPQVMKGYWNMPTETQNTLRGGWLFTGDIARMDEDGYFYIVDRKKDMVIAGGFNIYPTNIERVMKEMPQILDVAAAGIPDPYRGETIKLWIVVKPGQTLTEAEVLDFAKKNLAKFEVPTMIEFRTELPKTLVGKVLRRALVAEEKKQAAGS